MPASAASFLSRPSCLSCPDNAASRQRLYGKDFVETLFVKQAALEHQLANRSSGGNRGFGDFRGRRVADIRTERGRSGGASIEEFLRPRRVGDDAVDRSEEHTSELQS